MWNKTVPVTGSFIVDIPSIFFNNWDAIEDVSGVQHYGLTSALSGRHSAGVIGVSLIGTTATITGNAASAQGAVAHDTTLGTSKVFSSTWGAINEKVHNLVYAYRAADYLVAASTTANVPFDTEVVDGLNEFNNTTYQFVAVGTGYHFIHAHLAFTAVGNVQVAVLIEQRNSSDVLIANPVTYRTILSSDETYQGITVILHLTAGDKIDVKISHTHTSSVVLVGGITKSFLNIYRMC